MSKKIKLVTPRLGGQPISRDIWDRVVSTVMPALDGSPSKKLKGGQSRSAGLKLLCRIDPEVKRQCLDLARAYMAEDLKAGGLVFPERQPTRARRTTFDDLEPDQQEIWRGVERLEIERYGKSTLTGWVR